ALRTVEARAGAVAPELHAAAREECIACEPGQREEAGSASVQRDHLDRHAGGDADDRQETGSKCSSLLVAHVPSLRRPVERSPEGSREVFERSGFGRAQTWTRTGRITIGMRSHCRRCWIILGVSLWRSRWNQRSLRNTSCPVTIVAFE